MTILTTRTVALAAIIALGSLLLTSAHAAILRSSNGTPVLTREGNCVTTNFEGSEDCKAAKAAASETASTGVADTATDREGVVYFDFNKTRLSHSAKHALDTLAKKLAPHDHDGKMPHHPHHHVVAAEGPVLTIVGYADRIGKADYNERLALRRAQAVRAYLLSKGVHAKKVVVRSLGKTVPKADCSADLPRAKLIDCLREDRRVEIEVSP